MNNIDKASTEFGDLLLKCSNEYPLLENHRRKQLIVKDIYDVEAAFEKGAQWAINEACKWLETALIEASDNSYIYCDCTNSVKEFIQTFRNTLE